MVLVLTSPPKARRSAGTDKVCRFLSEPKESSAAYYDRLVEILGVRMNFRAVLTLILQRSMFKAEILSAAGSPAMIVLLSCIFRMTLAK